MRTVFPNYLSVSSDYDNTFIHSIVVMIRETGVFIKHFDIAPDFAKGFSCSLFCFLAGWVVVSLILGCWTCVSELDSSTYKTKQGRKSLRAEPLNQTHDMK